MRFIQTIIGAALLAAAHAGAIGAGFQSVKFPSQDGVPIRVSVWYPSPAAVAKQNTGVVTQEVAIGADVEGKGLPLIVFSHGTGGFGLSHYDTALALANAGFVVAAVTHPGDNYADQSRSVDILARPRHVTGVIDYMLGTWNGRESLAPDRIGIFGHSAGAFTALVSVGGMPDLNLIPKHCEANRSDFACTLLAANKDPLEQASRVVTPEMRDGRIRAAVIAAPALGFTFSAGGLNGVDIPVQLWGAENDVLLPPRWYAEAVRNSLRKEPDYHAVAKAGHFDFLAPCSEKLLGLAPQICASGDGFDREVFHRRFNADVVSFFIKTLGSI
ncbi:MAG: dienelactone hydrolase [Pseudomonadota bacterium]